MLSSGELSRVRRQMHRRIRVALALRRTDPGRRPPAADPRPQPGPSPEPAAED